MVVEKFSRGMINSGIFKLYIAIGFFGTSIFFVLNAQLFTPLEMIIGIVIVTVTLKGISNIMLSLVISFFNLDNKRDEIEFKHNTDNIDSLLSDLTMQDVATS